MPFGILDSYFADQSVYAPNQMPLIVLVYQSYFKPDHHDGIMVFFCIFLSISNQRLLEIDLYCATCPTLQLIGKTSFCYIFTQESASCFDRKDNAYISASQKLKGHLKYNS